MKVVAVFLFFAFCSSSVLCGSIQSRNILDKGTEAFVRKNVDNAQVIIPDRLCLPDIVIDFIDFRIKHICFKNLSTLTAEEIYINSLIALHIENLGLKLENLTVTFDLELLNVDLDPAVNVTTSVKVEIRLIDVRLNLRFNLVPGALLQIVGIEDVGTTVVDFNLEKVPKLLEETLRKTVDGVTANVQKLVHGLLKIVGRILSNLAGGLDLNNATGNIGQEN